MDSVNLFRKLGFALFWLLFSLYAFLLAPGDDPGTLDLIIRLSSGQWEGINPLVVALFNLMGVWPLIYCGVMVVDGANQSLKAWPFALGAFGFGAFSVLPYLALREPSPQAPQTLGRGGQWFQSRILGAIALGLGCGFLAYGLGQGDWADFWQQWHQSRFIHVMSLDFCALSVVFPALLGDDLSRRGVRNPLVFWTIAFIPFLGPLVYGVMRPNLVLGAGTNPAQNKS
jgi:hypothetical protein